MLSVQCKNDISFESEAETNEAIVLFDLNSLGVDAERFLNELRGSFEGLEWDHYDVRREQIAILQKWMPGMEAVPASFKPFYAGQLSLEELMAGFPMLPEEAQLQMRQVAPYRKRSTSKFLLSHAANNAWDINRLPNASIAQAVAATDYRCIPRGFKETAPEVVEHKEFKTLLASIGQLVHNVREHVKAIEVTCWQTGIVATPLRAGSNSPEGIHQDGADFIVSALVVNRDNIRGGMSRVFGPDKSTEHLEVVLGPGQGIFQVDAGSSLWHDVTPVSVEDPTEGNGVRNLFGFDINIRETTE